MKLIISSNTKGKIKVFGFSEINGHFLLKYATHMKIIVVIIWDKMEFNVNFQ